MSTVPAPVSTVHDHEPFCRAPVPAPFVALIAFVLFGRTPGRLDRLAVIGALAGLATVAIRALSVSRDGGTTALCEEDAEELDALAERCTAAIAAAAEMAEPSPPAQAVTGEIVSRVLRLYAATHVGERSAYPAAMTMGSLLGFAESPADCADLAIDVDDAGEVERARLRAERVANLPDEEALASQLLDLLATPMLSQDSAAAHAVGEGAQRPAFVRAFIERARDVARSMVHEAPAAPAPVLPTTAEGLVSELLRTLSAGRSQSPEPQARAQAAKLSRIAGDPAAARALVQAVDAFAVALPVGGAS